MPDTPRYTINWPAAWRHGVGSSTALAAPGVEPDEPWAFEGPPAGTERREVPWEDDAQGFDPAELTRARDDDDASVVPHQYTFTSVYNTINRLYRTRTGDEALRHSPEDARSMWRDPFIKDLIWRRVRPVMALPYELEPDDPDDEEQVAVCARIGKLIDRIPRFQGLKRTLLLAIFFGKYGTQIKVDRVLPNGQRVMIDGEERATVVRWWPVHGDKLWDDWEGNTGVYVYGPFRPENARVITGDQGRILMLDRPFWRRRFLIHRVNLSDVDYLYEADLAAMVQGVGMRSEGFWGWWLRQEFLGYWSNALQRISTNGQFVGFYEEGNIRYKNAVKRGLATLAQENYAVVPKRKGFPDMKVYDHIPLSAVAYEEIKGGVEHIEAILTRLFLGQDDAPQDGGAGSEGKVAEVRDNDKALTLRGDAIDLGETLTSDLLPVLIESNTWEYKGKTYRKLPFHIKLTLKIDSPKLLERLTVAEKLVAVGVELSKRQLRDEGGFAAPEDPGDATSGGQGQEAAPEPGDEHATLGPGGKIKEPKRPAAAGNGDGAALNVPGEAEAPRPSPNKTLGQLKAKPDRFARVPGNGTIIRRPDADNGSNGNGHRAGVRERLRTRRETGHWDGNPS